MLYINSWLLAITGNTASDIMLFHSLVILYIKYPCYRIPYNLIKLTPFSKIQMVHKTHLRLLNCMREQGLESRLSFSILTLQYFWRSDPPLEDGSINLPKILDSLSLSFLHCTMHTTQYALLAPGSCWKWMFLSANKKIKKCKADIFHTHIFYTKVLKKNTFVSTLKWRLISLFILKVGIAQYWKCKLPNSTASMPQTSSSLVSKPVQTIIYLCTACTFISSTITVVCWFCILYLQKHI